MKIKHLVLALLGGNLVQAALMLGLYFQPSTFETRQFASQPFVQSSPLETTNSDWQCEQVNLETLSADLSSLIKSELSAGFISRQEAERAEIQLDHSSVTRNSYTVNRAEPEQGSERWVLREEAAEESRQIMEAAIMSGYWTSKDNLEIATLMTELSEEQRLALIDQFMTALNQQQLILDEPPYF